MIRCKRIYEDPDPEDGQRILVDRLWPRGVSKEDAQLDDWREDLAPSNELREWFDHDPAKWSSFKRVYRYELCENDGEVAELRSIARSGTLILLYAASDVEHNNARVLASVLEAGLD